MTETVKVQRPIVTSGGESLWLIYDKKRRHVTQVPDGAIPSNVKQKMGKDHKAFFTGAWSSIVGWGLSDRVKDEAW